MVEGKVQLIAEFNELLIKPNLLDTAMYNRVILFHNIFKHYKLLSIKIIFFLPLLLIKELNLLINTNTISKFFLLHWKFKKKLFFFGHLTHLTLKYLNILGLNPTFYCKNGKTFLALLLLLKNQLWNVNFLMPNAALLKLPVGLR